MQGMPMLELNRGIYTLYKNIYENKIIRRLAEIAIVTFGDEGVSCCKEFDEKILTPPVLNAGGMTPMGEAVNLALDMIEARVNAYSEVGCQYYTPWLVLMTDGCPNGSIIELHRAIERVNELVNNNELTILPIAVGSGADIEILKNFSPNLRPMMLKDLNFVELFDWVCENITNIAASSPGGKYMLTDVSAWGETSY